MWFTQLAEGKKSSQVDTKSPGVYPIEATTISIAHLLEIVNSTHQSLLSEDVLAHFGETRNPDGVYSDKVLFSERTSDERLDKLLEELLLNLDWGDLTEFGGDMTEKQ